MKGLMLLVVSTLLALTVSCSTTANGSTHTSTVTPTEVVVTNPMECKVDPSEKVLFSSTRYCVSQIEYRSTIVVRIDPESVEDAFVQVDLAVDWLESHGYDPCPPQAIYFAISEKMIDALRNVKFEPDCGTKGSNPG